MTILQNGSKGLFTIIIFFYVIHLHEIKLDQNFHTVLYPEIL